MPEPLSNSPLSVGQCATLACVLEATAPKPGNVHRGADFEDLTYPDLIFSAVAIGPAMEAAATQKSWHNDSVGGSDNAVCGGHEFEPGHDPAASPAGRRAACSFAEGRRGNSSTAARCGGCVFGLRSNPPGSARGDGHGRRGRHCRRAPADLLSAMRLAAERDLVARQYADGFCEVFDVVVPALFAGLDRGWPVNTAIVHAQLTVMSRFSDSLIARKCGPAVAQQAADHAASVLESGSPENQEFWRAAGDLDFWLRSDGHRRNPGTTADLLASGLFVLLRDGIMRMPLRLEA